MDCRSKNGSPFFTVRNQQGYRYHPRYPRELAEFEIKIVT